MVHPCLTIGRRLIHGSARDAEWHRCRKIWSWKHIGWVGKVFKSYKYTKKRKHGIGMFTKVIEINCYTCISLNHWIIYSNLDACCMYLYVYACVYILHIYIYYLRYYIYIYNVNVLCHLKVISSISRHVTCQSTRIQYANWQRCTFIIGPKAMDHLRTMQTTNYSLGINTPNPSKMGHLVCW